MVKRLDNLKLQTFRMRAEERVTFCKKKKMPFFLTGDKLSNQRVLI